MKKPTVAAKGPKRPATKRANARPAAGPASKGILTAGITALSNAGEQAIARQSRVFESLLGIAKPSPDAKKESGPNPLAAALDPFGFRKFEDVFDQRVARALDNIGAPSAEAFAALAAEVERLRALVATLETRTRKRS